MAKWTSNLNGNREKGAVYTFSKANVLDGLLTIQALQKIQNKWVKSKLKWLRKSFKQAVEVVTDDNEIARQVELLVKL